MQRFGIMRTDDSEIPVSLVLYAHSHSIAYMLLLPHGLLESRGEAILNVLRKG